MTSYQTFQEMLRTSGKYETHVAQRLPAPIRISAINSFRYAATIIGILFRCGYKHLVHKFDYAEWSRICMASVHFAERLGGIVTFEGFEQRAAYDGPVVYVANHMSTLETMVLPITLIAFGKLAIILKKSLTELPFAGAAAVHLGCIGVTRENVREDLKTVLVEGRKRLAQGHSVLLFPQSTRQAVFDSKRFNTLGSKLAERAGVPVVPIAVKTDFLQTGKWIKDFGAVDPNKPIRFACGPVLPASLGSRATHEQSVVFIETRLKAWGLPITSRLEEQLR